MMPRDLFEGMIKRPARAPRDLFEGIKIEDQFSQDEQQAGGAVATPLGESSPIIPERIPELSPSMIGLPDGPAKRAMKGKDLFLQVPDSSETPYRGIIRRDVYMSNHPQPKDLKGVKGRDQLEHLLDIPRLEKDFKLPPGLIQAQIDAENKKWDP